MALYSLTKIAVSILKLSIAYRKRGGLLFCSLLLILSACGKGPALSGSTPSISMARSPVVGVGIKRALQPGGAEVFFTSSTSYASALRTITVLGLALSVPCMQAQTDNRGNVVSSLPWEPVGRKEYFFASQSTSTSGKIGGTPTVTIETNLPTLLVNSTATSPADWLTRLHADRGVSSIKTSYTVNCPSTSAGPHPGIVTSIPLQQVDSFAILTFTSTKVDYDDALYTAYNLGFRLAAPCYEQEAGKPADWHPMGQAQSFATTHTLTVATSLFSPTDWRTRALHASGVIALDTTHKYIC